MTSSLQAGSSASSSKLSGSLDPFATRRPAAVSHDHEAKPFQPETLQPEMNRQGPKTYQSRTTRGQRSSRSAGVFCRSPERGTVGASNAQERGRP